MFVLIEQTWFISYAYKLRIIQFFWEKLFLIRFFLKLVLKNQAWFKNFAFKFRKIKKFFKQISLQ